MSNRKKVARPSTTPPTGKTVGQVEAPPSGKMLRPLQGVAIDSMDFEWNADSVDHGYEGSWDWSLSPKEAKDVLQLLSSLDGLTWREIKEMKFHSKRQTRALHHDQPVTSICTEAQRRLVELEIEAERVFRLRHGNLIRVWGYLSRNVFCVVWFDRYHQVCPTE